MYIDPALEEREKREAEESKTKYRNATNDISWKDFKSSNVNI